MQDLMNMLKDQSKVIGSLQDTIKSLNFTIKSLNDKIEKMKDVDKNVDKNVLKNIFEDASVCKEDTRNAHIVSVHKNASPSKCLEESIGNVWFNSDVKNVNSKNVHENVKPYMCLLQQHNTTMPHLISNLN